MIEIKHLAGFLDRIHLFHGLSLDDLEAIALKLQQRETPADTLIFERGAKPDGFYLIYKGKVKVTRPREKGEDFLAILSAGDYFGEEALFENRNRSASIRTLEDSLLLFLSREDFNALLAKYEVLKPNFQVAIKSRKLARQTMFKWLGKNEVIYFIARRHKIRLLQMLLGPLLALSLPIALIGWGALADAQVAMIAGGLLILVIGLWAIWQYVDWGNDYYIVTNQRVVWLEKVIGIYDSRQEAPLSTILSVNTETDLIGRQLDYGNVSVRTFVGNIQFNYVDHPHQAAGMIRELWDRTKSRSSQAQKEAMKNAIRAKLGLPVKEIQKEELPPVVVPEDKEVQKKGLLRLALSNMFKMRTEEGGTVTYHKHWIVLLQQLSLPGFFFLILSALLVSRLWTLANDPELVLFADNFRLDTVVIIILFLMLPAVGGIIWQYLDWSNDIFKVTPEEIIDIDRTPFGTEERRAAQIENILSTEYKRIGLMGYLFNYGTVYIVVGGSKLSFQDVLDPAGVQADINRRRMARIAQKSEEAANLERERMAAWLVAYHQNRDEFDIPENISEEELKQLSKAAGQDLGDLAEEGLSGEFMEGMEG